MKLRQTVFLLTMLTILLPLFAAGEVVLDFVTVTNVGNAAQSPANRDHSDSGGDGRGAVAYSYHISRNLITVAQYAEFLNAVAKTDPHELYNRQYLGRNAYGDYTGREYGTLIERNGTDGDHSYTVAPGAANLPIPGVSWFDAARFANWMHNGQGNGSIETGAYDLTGLDSYADNAGKVANYATTSIAKELFKNNLYTGRLV